MIQTCLSRSPVRGTLLLLAGFILVAFAGSGCSVKPYQRGNLADPIMQFESDARQESFELKWTETREGSSGGTGGAGGGCACG